MFVDVISVLEVAVPIVEVIHVVSVLDSLVTVSLEMGPLVIGMDDFLGMSLAIVKVVDVSLMLNGLVTISREMLVVGGRVGCSRTHGGSFPLWSWRSAACPGPYQE